MISIVERLKLRFNQINEKPIEDSDRHICCFNRDPYVLVDGIKVDSKEYNKNPDYYGKRIEELYPKEETYDIFYETLMNKFLDFLDTDILPNEDNSDKIIDLIIEFCEKNNLSTRLINNNRLNQVEGRLNHNTIEVFYPDNVSSKELIFVILHEISHFITNKSSNDKVKKFLSEPNKCGVDINDFYSLKKELDYILMPAESANWAFTLSLRIFDELKINPNDLYKSIKIDFSNYSNNFTKSFYYRKLPDPVKPYYQIIAYCLKLKEINKQSSRKYMTRLSKFVSLTSKYHKRLIQKFGKK
ncbi:MAG: hypothetical protein K9H48_07980 [Melioribacteraceae bacterium]|nr:hypothetical protein [Melioribacteraceae bacterium]